MGHIFQTFGEQDLYPGHWREKGNQMFIANVFWRCFHL